jgi:dTDP-4-amino-4,6-dideoxygalactose transaminase
MMPWVLSTVKVTQVSAAHNRLPLVDLARQYANLRADLAAATDRVFGSMDFIQGSETVAFEREFAAFCGATHAVACGNGTDALELALTANGVGPGDEVITVAHTFAATAEAIVRVGAIPRFVDVDPETLLMDVGQVAKAVNQKTTAIVPVHLYGSCVDMDALMPLAHRHGLKVIEDAAQAHGARMGARRAGTAGDVGCFSFYPSKNLGAYGDAGAVVTSSGEIAARVRQLRDHGRTGKYEHEIIGRNSRMDSLQAAFLRVKLHHLDDWNKRRRDLASRYRFLLEDMPEVELVEAPRGAESIYHLFVIQVDDRDAVRKRLEGSGIGTGVHYPLPVHLQPAFARVGELSRGTLPVTERAAERVLSLPMFPEMENSEVDWVVTELGRALNA